MKDETDGALKEREKELDTLYLMAELCARPGLRRRELLEESSALLGGAFRNPGGIRIFISWRGLSVPDSPPPAEEKNILRAPIPFSSGGEGEIMALYVEPPSRGPVFLEREGLLLESIGKLLGETLRRLRAEARIRRQNSALRELLVQMGGERKRLLREIRRFIEGEAAPLLRRLVKDSSETGKISALRLQEILKRLPENPDENLPPEEFNLSPRESEICGLIRGGMSSKEIAGFLGLSELTVERHRHNIRKKLGLRKDLGLASYLMGSRSL